MHGCFSKTPAIIEVDGQLLEPVQIINAHLGIKTGTLSDIKYKIIFIHSCITYFMCCSAPCISRVHQVY